MTDETELHDAVAEMKANAPSPNASSRLYLRAVATIKSWPTSAPTSRG